jgi:hypothetical protein
MIPKKGYLRRREIEKKAPADLNIMGDLTSLSVEARRPNVPRLPVADNRPSQATSAHQTTSGKDALDHFMEKLEVTV